MLFTCSVELQCPYVAKIYTKFIYKKVLDAVMYRKELVCHCSKIILTV